VQALEELATTLSTRDGNPCCEFAEVEIPRKFSHIGNYHWKHQILSLSLSAGSKQRSQETKEKSAQSLTQAK